MKKLTQIVLTAVVAVSLAVVCMAAGYYQPTPVINSAGTTNGVVNFPSWPMTIAGNGSGTTTAYTTNVTKIDVSGGKDVAFEFNVSSMQASASNIVFQIGRNIRGLTPTNATQFATNGLVEWFDTVTVALPNVAGVNAMTNKNYSPTTGKGGITTFYIGWIGVPPLTTLTNYSVYVNPQ